MTLTEFLLARIAEDEAQARTSPEHYAPFEREWEWCPKARPEPLGDLPGGPDASCECFVYWWKPSERALRECEAKRRIVKADVEADQAAGAAGGGSFTYEDGRAEGLEAVVAILAAVYSDHPDYQDEWQP